MITNYGREGWNWGGVSNGRFWRFGPSQWRRVDKARDGRTGLKDVKHTATYEGGHGGRREHCETARRVRKIPILNPNLIAKSEKRESSKSDLSQLPFSLNFCLFLCCLLLFWNKRRKKASKTKNTQRSFINKLSQLQVKFELGFIIITINPQTSNYNPHKTPYQGRST